MRVINRNSLLLHFVVNPKAKLFNPTLFLSNHHQEVLHCEQNNPNLLVSLCFKKKCVGKWHGVKVIFFMYIYFAKKDGNQAVIEKKLT